MTLRSATKTLLVATLALPIVQAVLFWVRGLVSNMGDEQGATIVGHVNLVCQIAWSISVVGLVIVLAVSALTDRPPEE
jgi:hypothetical protein